MRSASSPINKILSEISRSSAAFIAALALIVSPGIIGCGGLSAWSRSTSAAPSSLQAANEAPGTFTRLETAEIRYSQSTYSLSGITEEDGLYLVADNIQWLRERPDEDLPWGGPIRVFRKQAFMDEWGPMSQRDHTGDPKNLVNGEIYTLDHRRLVAYRAAGRKTIPVEWASLGVVKDNRWKFTTSTGGMSITPIP